jgi:hypothetical protein
VGKVGTWVLSPMGIKAGAKCRRCGLKDERRLGYHHGRRWCTKGGAALAAELGHLVSQACVSRVTSVR